MKPLILLAALLTPAAASTALGQTAVVTTGPVVAGPVAKPVTPTGPAIRIDPTGLNGGAGGDISAGAGLVVVDPLSGTASVVVAPSTTTTLQGGAVGQNASAIPTAPTSLDPSPRLDSYPYCRERNDPRCRVR